MGIVGTLLTPFRLVLATFCFLMLTFSYGAAIAFAWPILSLFQLLCCCFKTNKKDTTPTTPAAAVRTERDLEKQGQQRVAIIGAGWTGLTTAKSLIDQGISVTIYEALDDVGGTWHSKVTYTGLSIHSPTYFVELDGFPYPDDKCRYERISASEVQAYLASYAKHFNLDKLIQFNSRVTAINHDTTTNKGTVTVNNLETGEILDFNNYDLILHTAFTSAPYTPQFKGSEDFGGEIFHASELSRKKLDELKNSGKKIVVLGAGKSAADVLLMFTKEKCDNITWLYRKSYYFLHYERVGRHTEFNSVFGKIRGFFFLGGLSLSVFSESLSCAFMRMQGMMTTVFDLHFDLKRCHLGTLKSEEIATLRKTKHVKANPTSLATNSIVLNNGQSTLDCDVLICATGYHTGLATMMYTVNGSLIKADLNKKIKLYQNLVLPEMPSLAFSTAGVYTIGPRRGVPIAEHITKYLHERPTVQAMKKSAAKNLVVANLNNPVLFSTESAALKVFVLWMLDCIRHRLFTFGDIFHHVYQIYVHNNLTTMHIRGMDKLHKPQKKGGKRESSVRNLDRQSSRVGELV